MTAVHNMLATRIPEFQVARTIQQQWGLFTDVAETTLTQQLRRYNKSYKFTPGNPNEAVKVKDLAPLYERMNVTSAQIELATKVRARLFDLMDREGNTGKHHVSLRAEIETYNAILKDVQKQQFDLGVDVYQGPAKPGGGRMGMQTTIAPDGSVIISQVMEATTEALSILDDAGITIEADASDDP